MQSTFIYADNDDVTLSARFMNRKHHPLNFRAPFQIHVICIIYY